jgi:hypothetical protein
MKMTLLDTLAGGFKVWARDLNDGSREFQVRHGRLTLARYRHAHDALEDAKGRETEFMDDLARRLKSPAVDTILATIAAVHGDDAEMMAVEQADKAKRRGVI